MIQAILFDFNGVIIDDEPLQLKAYQQAFSLKGITFTENEYYDSLGMNDETFVRHMFERKGHWLSDEIMQLIIERKTETHRMLIKDELPLFPGVATLIKAAARHYTLGVVSMSRRSDIEYVLERAQLRAAFAVIVSAEDVAACKPDPACYLRGFKLADEKRRAANHHSIVPEECVAIEDSPPGIQAARRAGMRTLGVTNTVSAEALRAAGADVVTASLADWTVDAVHHVFSSKQHLAP